MISPARVAAYEVLRAVNTRKADLPAALARRRVGLEDERDRALAGEIATGTLRWMAELDHLVAHFARRPVDRLDPEVLDVLRLGAYQLLHLDRVPAAAAVDDAVRLTRRAGKASAAGFVNGVLRAISRNRGRLPLPTRDDPLEYLSITLSHPLWLAARWLDRYGLEAAAAWMAFNNRPAPLTLRVNTLKTSPDALAEALARSGVAVRRTRYAPHGLIVERGNPLTTPLAGEGLFLVQDEASQLVTRLAGVRPGWRVLDACAAPGGKATAMAADMADRGLIVAADVRARRIELLRRTVAASGATSIRLARADLERPLPFRAPFDCVVVDAPCSGLGTIRRDPDIRWRRHEGDLAALATAQLTMLGHAAEVVRPGGRLVYATCSSEPEENEDVVRSFLAARPDFVSAHLGAGGRDLAGGLEAVLNEAGHLRTYPHVHGLEAFFGALMVRR